MGTSIGNKIARLDKIISIFIQQFYLDLSEQYDEDIKNLILEPYEHHTQTSEHHRVSNGLPLRELLTKYIEDGKDNVFDELTNEFIIPASNKLSRQVIFDIKNNEGYSIKFSPLGLMPPFLTCEKEHNNLIMRSIIGYTVFEMSWDIIIDLGFNFIK